MLQGAKLRGESLRRRRGEKGKRGTPICTGRSERVDKREAVEKLDSFHDNKLDDRDHFLNNPTSGEEEEAISARADSRM